MNRELQIEAIHKIAAKIETAEIYSLKDTILEIVVDAEQVNSLLYHLHKAGWDTKHQRAEHFDKIEVYVRLNQEPDPTHTATVKLRTADIMGLPASKPIPTHTMQYGITVRGLDYAFAAFLYLPDAFVLYRHLQLITPEGGTVYSIVNLQTGAVLASTDDPR